MSIAEVKTGNITRSRIADKRKTRRTFVRRLILSGAPGRAR